MEQSKTCKACGINFSVSDNDLRFYEKMEVPSPTLCHDCRQKRRLSWCNERKLYERNCDKSGKKILSMYPQDVPFPVYHNNEWWGDSWDPLNYGRDIDFNRPFFEQWAELSKFVPRPSLNVTYKTLENSEYVNSAGNLRNCYLIFDSDYSRECMYGYTINKCTDTVDSLKVNESELCYECIDCIKCYNLKYSINCQNCNDSWFLKNCIGCSNCFGCINLQRKQYYFFNQKLSREEYEKQIAKIKIGSFSELNAIKEKTRIAYLKFPNKFMRGFQNQNCTGDGLFYCKNTSNSFDCRYAEDCSYLYSMSFNTKTSYDIYQFGENVELCYESTVLGYGCFNVKFSNTCHTTSNNLEYCEYCMSSKNLFGCIGLRHQENCILNKKYKSEKYEQLRKKLIEHMKNTGEYREFFPATLSPFPYNITTAELHYPLTKEQAEKEGLKWEEKNKKEYRPQTFEIPDDIKEVKDSITNEILACSECGKNYKITNQELAFYIKIGVPIPRKCPDCRHEERIKLRNPQKLWKRACQNCKEELLTSYEDSKPEIIYCEKCYLEKMQ